MINFLIYYIKLFHINFFQGSQQQAEEKSITKETKTEVEIRMEESDRARLSYLEDQLKQLLEALMSVADMVSGAQTPSPNIS